LLTFQPVIPMAAIIAEGAQIHALLLPEGVGRQ
jgi:hypothetical protein